MTLLVMLTATDINYTLFIIYLQFSIYISSSGDNIFTTLRSILPKMKKKCKIYNNHAQS